jgi:hypothetical protein
MTIQSKMYASTRRLDGTLRSAEFIVLMLWLCIVLRSIVERRVASGSAAVDREGVSWS